MDYKVIEELARSYSNRAQLLFKRAERTIDSTVQAKLLLAANAEQREAIHWTMKARGLRPNG